jgi:hypothetical protein
MSSREACERHERRADLFRRPGEAGIVSGEVFVGEKTIGRVHAGDAGEPELLRQATRVIPSEWEARATS